MRTPQEQEDLYDDLDQSLREEFDAIHAKIVNVESQIWGKASNNDINQYRTTVDLLRSRVDRMDPRVLNIEVMMQRLDSQVTQLTAALNTIVSAQKLILKNLQGIPATSSEADSECDVPELLPPEGTAGDLA